MIWRQWRILVAVAVVAIIAQVALAGESALKKLLPRGGEVSGWSIYADTYQYCASPDELYKIYDGGDQEWIDAGVAEAAQQVYKKGKLRMVVTVHRMKTWQRAKALYKKKDAGIKSQPGYRRIKLKQAYSLCRANGVTTGYGWTKTYFMTYTLNTAKASGTTTTRAFMKAVVRKIK